MSITPTDAEHAGTIIATLVGVIGLLVSIIGFSIKYIVSSINGRIKSLMMDLDKQDGKVDGLDHRLTVIETQHAGNHR